MWSEAAGWSLRDRTPWQLTGRGIRTSPDPRLVGSGGGLMTNCNGRGINDGMAS